MKESIISLETAILAKEKGFDCDYFYHYNEDGQVTENSDIVNIGCEGGLSTDHHLMNNTYAGILIAPTQALLQKWLREEHHIYVSVERCVIGSDEWEFGYFIEWLPKENHEDKRRVGSFKEKRSFQDNYPYNYVGAWHTYEEGLEKGLQEALKLI
jgi:hypothetical protein